MVLRAHGPQIDRLMAAVATEYMEEVARMRRSPYAAALERVQRLVAGEDPGEIDGLEYAFDAWHLGMIAKGADAEPCVRGAGCRTQLPGSGGVAW